MYDLSPTQDSNPPALFISERKFVCATIKDLANNTTFMDTAEEYKVDKTPPTFISANRSGWYSSPTDVTLTTGDAESGIDWIQYTWDDPYPCAQGKERYSSPGSLLPKTIQ